MVNCTCIPANFIIQICVSADRTNFDEFFPLQSNSPFEIACNSELLNIYKKDDFNKDIASTSQYQRVLAILQETLIRVKLYLEGPEIPGNPYKI